MADKVRPTSQAKRPQSSSSRQLPVSRSVNRPATAPTAKIGSQIDLLAKEEEYKRLNAELEAKTAELVRQAEEVARERNEVLSKPIPSHLNLEFAEDCEDFGDFIPSVKQPTIKAVTSDRGAKIGHSTKPFSQKKKPTAADYVAIAEDFGDFSLAKTISSLIGRDNEDITDEQQEDSLMPNIGEGFASEVQIRCWKAKLQVLQEEINRISNECDERDKENRGLSSRLKEVEEDRARLQKTTSAQQAQLEKHKALAEDTNRHCASLRQQVTTLQKELEGAKRAQKQMSSSHSALEVRLNRALEEAEKSKAELNKLRQNSKESANQEQQRIEALQAENKKLEKQKTELINGFKKQLKLIDILKKQKLHFEAARMLAFTEEEFMKALDWSKS